MLHFSPVSVSVGGKLGTGFMLAGGEEILHGGGINFTLSQPGMVSAGLAPRLLGQSPKCGQWVGGWGELGRQLC